MTAALIPELYVDDIDRSVSFYVQLGFSILYARATERFAMLERDGAQIMIEEPIGRTFLIHPLSHPRGSGVSFQIAVTSIDGLWKAIPAGTTIVLPIERHAYQRDADSVRVRQFVIADPDGYLLRFSETIA
ncbi:VOC family protein [Sphingomonas oligophenolica]|uniref:VOC family protein n=1 Tax=Sphingomonas oligophenolica TaxID=301154 RepID=A0A502CMQ2_9SPHN|nr:VOC family protein [Sphingomonas oligophenolica]TPG14477.1 VOC family protein [Sphingomonas oligophenolica]